MRKVVWALIGVVLMALVVYGAGYLCPPEFRGESARNYTATVDEVWDAVNDVRSLPMTGSQLRSLTDHKLVANMPTWVEDMGHSVVTVRTTLLERPEKIVREMEDSVVPMTAVWRLTIVPSAGGSRVMLRMDGRIETGTWQVPIFRMIMSFGGGEKSVVDYLERLEAVLAARQAG